MEGIESVEGILRKGTPDEAPLTVVHIDGDEGQSGYPAHGQHDTADGSLQDAMMPKDIEQQDE